MPTYYVFLTRRPQDKQAWPLVYERQDLADAAPYRVSPVMPVEVSEVAESDAEMLNL